MTGQLPQKPVELIASSQPGDVIEVSIELSEPGVVAEGWPGRDSMGTQLVSLVRRPPYEDVWILTQELPAEEARSSNDMRIPEDSVPGLREFRSRLRAGTLRIKIIMDDEFGVALCDTLLGAGEAR